MSEKPEAKPDEKPSPEQRHKAAPGRGSKVPLFTKETRTIIWGLQARAVQVRTIVCFPYKYLSARGFSVFSFLIPYTRQRRAWVINIFILSISTTDLRSQCTFEEKMGRKLLPSVLRYHGKVRAFRRI